ncbi:MAG: hypothetical protein HY900_16895 [Deltaproteobacteria bacterium]|nr:hypothetical protein [Deltaproteobacteria bacterium]
MKHKGYLVLALLLASGCAAQRQAERGLAVRLQEAEARAEELKARAEWETAERAKAEAALQEARKQLAGLADEQKKAQARTDDLSARLKACGEREAGQRADLDLCGKARTLCEEEQARREGEGAAARVKQEEERRRREAEMERCRGRVSDLEAQALLLSAEKMRAEREKAERVDELKHS